MFLDLKVVHGFTIQKSQGAYCHFALLSWSGLEKVLDINEEALKEAFKLFYANLIIPEVHEGTELILMPHR